MCNIDISGIFEILRTIIICPEISSCDWNFEIYLSFDTFGDKITFKNKKIREYVFVYKECFRNNNTKINWGWKNSRENDRKCPDKYRRRNWSFSGYTVFYFVIILLSSIFLFRSVVIFNTLNAESMLFDFLFDLPFSAWVQEMRLDINCRSLGTDVG